MKGKQNGKNFWQKQAVYIPALVGLFLLLIVSVFLSITFGNAEISIRDAYRVAGYELFGLEGLKEYASGAVHDVIWLIRFPRVIRALFIGMTLAVCGVVMQAQVKNPMADPYILGITSGAVLGAALAIMLGLGAFFGTKSVGVMAFLGALGASLLVMTLSGLGGRSSVSRLVLAGMAVNAVCSAFSSGLLYFSNNKTAAQEIAFWQMGSLAGATSEENLFLFPIMLVGVLFFWSQHRRLNLMLFGDEAAITLGTDTHKWRMVYAAAVALLIGLAVYAAGTIGFLGLIVPHGVRMLFGTDHKKVIPVSALTGAIFLIWADVLCRTIIPNAEMPVGILISMIGAPCFIYLMIKKSYGFGGSRE